ncbi:ImmA/IrrE family metallo-endopeptidase [Micromonospora sp. URMC 103]|uniref:ImmA/IrrE family metallo-endopeptidase n=1 Tax=Micromonospora sp. URMC 103 TaxID=3423406 RepID=UPI003F1DA59C
MIQARAMSAELDRLRPGAADRLRRDALAELSSWDDIVVRLDTDPEVTQDPDAPRCSVAGAYLAGAGTAVLAIARSASRGRRAFTGLHELGHHLQRTQPSLMELLVEQPDGGLALEDAACDAFAAQVLLPERLVDAHIGPQGPSGQNVFDLWAAASASRAAVCVRASQRLTSPGHVILLEAAGTVSFSASHGLPPLRRGSDQSSTAIIRDALARPSGRATGRTRLRYRDGILGDQLHAQVVPMDGFLVAVAVVDGAAWESFSLSSREVGPTGTWWTCGYAECGHEFPSFMTRCERCREPTCPACERCACAPRVKERRCAGCFLSLPAHVFIGAEERCINCS